MNRPRQIYTYRGSGTRKSTNNEQQQTRNNYTAVSLYKHNHINRRRGSSRTHDCFFSQITKLQQNQSSPRRHPAPNKQAVTSHTPATRSRSSLYFSNTTQLFRLQRSLANHSRRHDNTPEYVILRSSFFSRTNFFTDDT